MGAQTIEGKSVIEIVDDTMVAIAEPPTCEALSQHLIQPERSYWPDILKPKGRWPNG